MKNWRNCPRSFNPQQTPPDNRGGGVYTDLEEYAKFASVNPVGYVATAEGDQPHIRAFLMWFANDACFYFHTGEHKKVCQQLRKNPKVEVCFLAPTHDKTMRVAGEVEFLDDSALKARLIEERPFLKAIVKGPEDSALVRKTKIFMLRLNKQTIFTRVKLVASHPAAGVLVRK